MNYSNRPCICFNRVYCIMLVYQSTVTFLLYLGEKGMLGPVFLNLQSKVLLMLSFQNTGVGSEGRGQQLELPGLCLTVPNHLWNAMPRQSATTIKTTSAFGQYLLMEGALDRRCQVCHKSCNFQKLLPPTTTQIYIYIYIYIYNIFV